MPPQLGDGATLATDPCEAARAIIGAALRTVSAAEGCTLYLVRKPDTMHLVAACEAAGVATALEDAALDGNATWRQVLAERRAVHLPDLTATPCPWIASADAAPARCALVAPLYVGECALGVVALTSCRPETFTAADGARLEALAVQAAHVLHHWARLLRAEAESACATAIVAGFADGVAVLDGEGRIARINAELAAIAGFTECAPVLPMALNDPDCPALLRILLDPCAGRVIGPYEVALNLPTGVCRTYRVVPSALIEPAAGELRVIRDVTAEREASDARALFISQVAHELRGPLQHIVGFTSLISDISDLPAENYQRFFGHIKDETDHLARLVDDLVELSRIELGRFTVRPQRVCLDALVSEVTDRLRPRAQFRGLDLTYDGPVAPVWALIDALRITQVLSNLIENALKFVPGGGAIAVSVRPEGESSVLVSIADTGPGIPAAAMERLFERFYQVRSEPHRSTQGMGLGLYTCQEIIRAHGGEIWAESEYGVGSTFRFRLERITP